MNSERLKITVVVNDKKTVEGEIKVGERGMDERDITRATGIPAARREILIRYYARLSEPERLAIHQEQTSIMRRQRSRWQHSQESLAYCSLIEALAEHYRLTHVGSSRQTGRYDPDKAEQLLIAKVKAHRSRSRSGAKRDQLLLHLPLIRRLFEVEKLSWREIAVFLADNYKLAVTHNYLWKVYAMHCGSLTMTVGRSPALPEIPDDGTVRPENRKS